MVIAWAFRAALAVPPSPANSNENLPTRLKGYLPSGPQRWLILATACFATAVLLSTLLSTSLRVSVWGETPGQDGYGAYNTVTFIALFAVVASRIKAFAQIEKLLIAIVAASILAATYGILQNYFVEPFNYAFNAAADIPVAQTGRAPSTFGNPVFAGGYFALAIPVTFALVLRTLDRWSPALHTAIWASALAIQLLGLVFTFSRGAWVGLAAGLVALTVLALLFLDGRLVRRIAVLLAISLAVTLLIAEAPDLLLSDTRRSVTERTASIGTSVTAQGLSGRTEIWSGSLDLILDRPWYANDDLPLAPLRPFIGYGPDMFRYTFPLAAPTSQAGGLHSHAHNILLHLAIEIGILGLLAFLAVIAAAFATGLHTLKPLRRTADPTAILIVVLLAALSGRAVEQMVGVGRIADTMLFWLLLATLAAAIRLAAPAVAPIRAAAVTAPRQSAPAALRPAFGLGLAIGLLVVLGTTTWVRNVNYVTAGFTTAAARDSFDSGDLGASLNHMDRAIALAPDVPLYHHNRAAILDAFRSADPESPNARTLVEQSYIASRQGFEANPFLPQARLALANASLQLAVSGYEGKDVEAIDQFTALTARLPNDYRMYNNLAAAFINLNRPRDALDILDQSLRLTDGNNRAARALYLRGLAYQNLSQPLDAIAAFQQSLQVDASGIHADDITTRLAALSPPA